MIKLHELSKRYRTAKGEITALDSASLTVESGEMVAIRGPSGSGKSTLLALVAGLATPSSGSVVVDDAEVSSMSVANRAAWRARHVGFVFQAFHLLPYLSVEHNILLGAGPNADARETAQRANELMERFGIRDRASHRPDQLSAGERQRAAMARALLNNPSLLLADEPTGNLDQDSAAAVMQWVGDFHKSGGTVLLVTHDDRIAAHAARRIHIERGHVSEAAQPDPVSAEA